MSKKGKGGKKTNRPLIEWVHPTNGETVGGLVGLTIRKNPLRKRDVIWVQVLLDGPTAQSYQQVSYTSAISTFFIDTTLWPDGDYLLTANATDGVNRISAPLALSFKN